MSETTGDPRELQKLIDFLNRPENLEPVRAEIRQAKASLARHKARGPEGFAEFEGWWEAHHRTGSLPSVKRK